MSDAFEHVQSLDAAWLGAQSTGELSRVFARGVRGMNALLRLFVFNIVPTALETLLVCQLLGRRYGIPFLITSLLSVTGFVAWSLFVVEKRIAVVAALNDNDNKLFTQFFNSLLNNEAVRSFTNERHEVGRYDELLGGAESLAVRDVKGPTKKADADAEFARDEKRWAWFEAQEHHVFRRHVVPDDAHKTGPSFGSPFASSSDIDLFLVGLDPSQAYRKCFEIYRTIRRNTRSKCLIVS